MESTKRKFEEDSSEILYSNKTRKKVAVEAPIHPIYGQRSALPGLDDETTMDGEDIDLDYDEDMDAIAYLRLVRQEATGIPNLLVASKAATDRDIYEDGVGDYRGKYVDGTYYAPDSESASDAFQAEEDAEYAGGRLAYFDSILSRFETLRAQLYLTPPEEAIDKLGSDHPTFLGRLERPVVTWWRWKVRGSDPLPVQIACMDKNTVLRLLKLITGWLKPSKEVDLCVSRWIWALLARLPDMSELTSEQVGVVRELGKKSVLIGINLQKVDMLEGALEAKEDDEEDTLEASYEEEEYENLSDDLDEADIQGTDGKHDKDMSVPSNLIGPQLPKIQEAVEQKQITSASPLQEKYEFDNPAQGEQNDEVAAAKARILARLQEPREEAQITEPEIDPQKDQISQEAATAENLSWNTRATVDMIITVAGELYGQRDLLEARVLWA
ncbi:hypothetical protein B0O99DRAFT_195751 [Bisporella sp. PMI_857]|nr:hypothetical protein B0O99DRAFT_195751 [Bisporella sp. PMI_857]